MNVFKKMSSIFPSLSMFFFSIYINSRAAEIDWETLFRSTPNKR